MPKLKNGESPISGGRVQNLDHLNLRRAMLARDMSVWEELHVLPLNAPSQGAKRCTYLQ